MLGTSPPRLVTSYLVISMSQLEIQSVGSKFNEELIRHFD